MRSPWTSLISNGGDVLSHIDASAGRLELRVYAQDDGPAAIEAALGDGATKDFNIDGFRRCLLLRLVMPFIPTLADTSRAIFLDLDAVALCDMEQARQQHASSYML